MHHVPSTCLDCSDSADTWWVGGWGSTFCYSDLNIRSQWLPWTVRNGNKFTCHVMSLPWSLSLSSFFLSPKPHLGGCILGSNKITVFLIIFRFLYFCRWMFLQWASPPRKRRVQRWWLERVDPGGDGLWQMVITFHRFFFLLLFNWSKLL